jgi:hypothetical protein
MDDNFNNMDYGVTALKLKKSDGSIIKLGDVLSAINTSLSNFNTLLTSINNLMSQGMGKNDGFVIDDTNAHNGQFTALFVVTESVITTVGGITMTAITLPPGANIPFDFTRITLGSGIVIVFGAETP